MIELQEKLALLHKVSLFKGIAQSDLRLIAQRMSETSFEDYAEAK